MVYRWQYNLSGYERNDTSNNALKTALFFMGMEYYTFGHSVYLLKDKRLLNQKDSSRVFVRINKFNEPIENRATLTRMICYAHWEVNDYGLMYYHLYYCEDYFPADEDYHPEPESNSGESGGGGGEGWETDPCSNTGGCDTGEEDAWENIPDITYDVNAPFADLEVLIDAPEEPLINNGIEVSDVTESIPNGEPRIIATTTNRNNTEDMTFGYDGNPSGILSDRVSMPNENLFNDMKSLFYWTTFFDSDLEAVGELLIGRFKNSLGGTYENSVLNQKVSVNHSFINFLKKFGNELNLELQRAGGNIDNVGEIDLGQVRPVFNGMYNKFHGLQILINDTEFTEINLEGFTVKADGKRIAFIEVIIHDHFGLDKHDALEYQNNHGGFASWWVLQHMRNKRPFETVVKVRRQLSWYP